jgi:hypothetical protein
MEDPSLLVGRREWGSVELAELELEKIRPFPPIDPRCHFPFRGREEGFLESVPIERREVGRNAREGEGSRWSSPVDLLAQSLP